MSTKTHFSLCLIRGKGLGHLANRNNIIQKLFSHISNPNVNTFWVTLPPSVSVTNLLMKYNIFNKLLIKVISVTRLKKLFFSTTDQETIINKYYTLELFGIPMWIDFQTEQAPSNSERGFKNRKIDYLECSFLQNSILMPQKSASDIRRDRKCHSACSPY